MSADTISPSPEHAGLSAGLARMNLAPPLAGPLLRYLDELLRWNRRWNLTAVRDRDEAVNVHLLDSLSLLPLLGSGDVIDVGTGGGLPGIPLALAEPGRRFVLLDSNSKKARFVRHAVLLLGLDNVSVAHSRVEDYRDGGSFGNVVSRAFTDVGRFAAIAGHLCAPHGRLLAMKGVYPAEELEALPESFVLAGVHPVSVPGMNAQRHIVALRPEQPRGVTED